MKFQIRKATVEDLPAIVELAAGVQQLHYENVPSLFKAPNVDETHAFFLGQFENEDAYLFVADADGEIAGYTYAVVMSNDENDIVQSWRFLSIEHLAVAQSHQRSGVGTALMDAANNLAKTLDLSRVSLSVWAFNAKAISFYEEKGFKPFRLNMEKTL